MLEPYLPFNTKNEVIIREIRKSLIRLFILQARPEASLQSGLFVITTRERPSKQMENPTVIINPTVREARDVDINRRRMKSGD